MKNVSTFFLQSIIVLIGVVVLALLIRLPLTEGRATNLNLFQIYSDPFILFAYAASIAFFVALFKAFKLLGYIRQNQIFSSISLGTLRSIKNCAIVLIISIIAAGLFTLLFHHKDDDPAGFVALCLGTTFICTLVVTAAAVVEKVLQKGVEIETENKQLKNI